MRIVSFKVAELAKQLGFDLRCSYYYDLTKFGETPVEWVGKLNANELTTTSDEGKIISCNFTTAPTQSELQTWLRNEHNLNISIQLGYGIPDSWWSYFIQSIEDDSVLIDTDKEFTSYEDALEEGLLHCLLKI